jgi:hypothetical protein
VGPAGRCRDSFIRHEPHDRCLIVPVPPSQCRTARTPNFTINAAVPYIEVESNVVVRLRRNVFSVITGNLTVILWVFLGDYALPVAVVHCVNSEYVLTINFPPLIPHLSPVPCWYNFHPLSHRVLVPTIQGRSVFVTWELE